MKEYMGNTLIVTRNEDGLPVREIFTFSSNSDPDNTDIRYTMQVEVWDGGWQLFTASQPLKITKSDAGGESDEVFDGDDIGAKLAFAQSWESPNLEESFQDCAIVKAILNRRRH